MPRGILAAGRQSGSHPQGCRISTLSWALRGGSVSDFDFGRCDGHHEMVWVAHYFLDALLAHWTAASVTAECSLTRRSQRPPFRGLVGTCSQLRCSSFGVGHCRLESEMIDFLTHMPANAVIFITTAVLALAATLIVLRRLI